MEPTASSGKSSKNLIILGVVMTLLVVLGVAQWQFNIFTKAVGKSATPDQVELNTTDHDTTHKATTPLSSCGSQPAKVSGPAVRVNIWAWNAQMGLIGANCGPRTMSGSLMEKYGVNVVLNRQDDTEKSKPLLIKFADMLSKGSPNPGEGIQFIVIMGDGASQALYDLNTKLKKYGPDYRAEIVGSVGYSRGEDAFMGPQAWKEDAANMKGGLVAGVLRDGDWNIAQAYLAANQIPNNPDEKYWDPDALNWVATDDYLKAGELYISGHCEDRKVVRNGKVTSEPAHHVCVQGVVTWTPGDVNVVKKKGGIIKLLSTRENKYQMPAVLIGIHKWNEDHPKQVEAILAGAFDYADQLATFPEALTRASRASHAVYNEETDAYWAKYYRGTTEAGVSLGGSKAMNLGDNLFLFGLDGDVGLANSPFTATYEGFGNVIRKQYPRILPDFPKAGEAVNLRFLTELKERLAPSTPERNDFEKVDTIAPEGKVATQNITIQFATGSADFTPQARETLDNLFFQLSTAAALNVEIDGHTDNTGPAGINALLSSDRAEAVKRYLQGRNARLFPDNRVSTHGFGDTKPIATNDTSDGRARNRRVTIILGEN
jgi:OOP family OmpA-OmpF porin